MSNPCEAARPAPLRCPTAAEVMSALLALLPRGRAWQSNEGGPAQGHSIAFEPTAFSPLGFVTDAVKPSTLWRFWKSVADIFTFVNQRFCDLRLEFWCATHKETHAEWLVEYGLPDACDPFPDLCTKVAAIGGTRCDYYQFIAARAGWSLSCVERINACGTRTRSRRALAGRARPGHANSALLAIVVDLGGSPSFTGPRHQFPLVGRMRAGRRLACGPNLGPLECLLARVVHAEITVSYEVI